MGQITATRDYVLELDAGDKKPAVLSVFGGKITTYRKLSEHVLEKLKPHLPFKREEWTDQDVLPGGNFNVLAFEEEVSALQAHYPFLDKAFATRLIRLYGTDARSILGKAAQLSDLGQLFGYNLYEAEVKWLVSREWARTAEDVLWRRTKLGLRLSEVETAALDNYLSAHLAELVGTAA